MNKVHLAYKNLLNRKKSALELRKSIFYFVRGIPYSMMHTGINSEEVITKNFGNCQIKAALLADIFELAGYKTRFVSFKYKLKKVIPEIKYLPDEADYHHTLQVLLKDKWITCDPTYDLPLKDLGYIVNDWNGVNSTNFCETPTSEISYSNIKSEKLSKEIEEFNTLVEKACDKYPKELESFSVKMEELFSNARGHK